MGSRKLNSTNLIAYMSGRAVVDREEIIGLFGDTYEIPAYTKLAKSYVATKISQTLAGLRDEKGRRNILAKRDRNGVKYVNIPVCGDLEVLNHIYNRIANDIAGQGESLEKVQLQIEECCRTGSIDTA